MTAMKEQPSARQIYGTIGPACADVKTLEAMFRAGMTGIRLNLSHVTLAQAADQVDALHKAAQRCGKQAELLIDMQGPELRVGHTGRAPERTAQGRFSRQHPHPAGCLRS